MDSYKAPLSPNLPVDDGIMRTQRQFADGVILDLNDDEIKNVFSIIFDIQKKYAYRSFVSQNHLERILNELNDEVTTRLASIGILASVDGAPLLTGEPPVVEIIGKLPSTVFAQYGHDHDKKKFEIMAANKRGEDYYGQKGEIDGSAKARDRRQKKSNRNSGKKSTE